MDFRAFFSKAMGGYPPFPYQERMGEEPWPDVLDIPTGLGKTAAIVIGWLYKRWVNDEDTPRRLVYCLPMRSLVRQTASEARYFVNQVAENFADFKRSIPTVQVLMGGDIARGWEMSPEENAILIGTQDQLLSRALNRAYAASRYRWPMLFALVHNDALWVFDEIQLMGVGVETSAQLEGFRRRFGGFGPSRSLWASATMNQERLSTVDHPCPEEGWNILRLTEEDLEEPKVRDRLGASKSIEPVPDIRIDQHSKVAGDLALFVRRVHEPGSLTLVVLNRVDRAQALFKALEAELDKASRAEGADGTAEGSPRPRLALIHSRFRPPDRRAAEDILLEEETDRIVVATQAIEAGIDVSAKTLITELAPWPSLIQRFGRCNRRGEYLDARIYWIDVDDGHAGSALPYDGEALAESRRLLAKAQSLGGAGPAILQGIAYAPPKETRPVLRRRDLLDLFDTTPDIAGFDIDVSRYIRDGDDSDVLVYWRDFGEEAPQAGMSRPQEAELCRVSIGQMKKFIGALKRMRDKAPNRAEHLHAFRWDRLEGRWQALATPRPGQVILLSVHAGGYSKVLGFTGETAKKGRGGVEEVGSELAPPNTGFERDPDSNLGVWVDLGRHLRDVREEADALVARLPLGSFSRAVVEAAAFHDVGKAHAAFQTMLTQHLDDELAARRRQADLWAKNDIDPRSALRRSKPPRPKFRHELASALAWLQRCPVDDADRDLIAYLIAAHHGKVRLSIRSLPGEKEPDTGVVPARFARGVWQGDPLPPPGSPPLTLPDGNRFEPLALDLRPMELGEGSWAERTLALRDHPDLGPFRLAFLETLVRVADGRASEKERQSSRADSGQAAGAPGERGGVADVSDLADSADNEAEGKEACR